MEIDLTRVPRGELAARALVEALSLTDDRAERHFLEVKSSIDLTTKEGLAKLAKFILGAANRMPDVAAGAFEGHAVMVLGVAQGSVPGIKPVEALAIERGVRPYLSVNGPRWDLQRVPVNGGREVLLILVDPPKWGQPAFPCFKDGPSLHNGQIIVRADGETRQATGEEVLQLQQRGRCEQPDVDLAVDIAGVAVAHTCDESVLEDHIERETARLEAAMPSSEPLPSHPLASLIRGVGHRDESRTVQQYEEQIASWAAECRASWSLALEAVAATITPTITISVTNRTRSFLEDVALEIHLEGPVRGLEPVEPEDFEPDSLLPSPPRAWGPWVDYSSIIPSGLSTYIPPMPSLPSSISFRNDGSVTVNVDVGDLRPLHTYRTDDDLVLVVDDENRTELNGTWKITARGHNAVYEGNLVMPVETQDITTRMERLLKLLRKDSPEDGEDSDSH